MEHLDLARDLDLFVGESELVDGIEEGPVADALVFIPVELLQRGSSVQEPSVGGNQRKGEFRQDRLEAPVVKVQAEVVLSASAAVFGGFDRDDQAESVLLTVAGVRLVQMEAEIRVGQPGRFVLKLGLN